MPPPHRILSALSLTLPPSSSSAFVSGTFLFRRSSPSYITPPRSFSSSSSISLSHSTMPYSQRKGGQTWREKTKTDSSVDNRLGEWSASGSSGQTQASVQPIQFGKVQVNPVPVQGQKGIWKPKSYGTVSGSTAVEAEVPVDKSSVGLEQNGVGLATPQKSSSGASKLFKGNLLENFTVDNSTYAQVQIRATFYPKFENEKSDQEIRTRMIEMVSQGLATLEVSLKHSGSLFMYAGNEGGAYAKNSFGNIYTAVGVFVLGRMLREAWGSEAAKKQAEFNDFLERNLMCISMELVTAVLGDHGQRPNEDFVVVTAVTELGNGKPKFYSTPEVIAFCRKWRLPTNHVWLFSTRKAVTSFFAAFDALCEEGTATTVCRALDEVADISIPGSKDHIKEQGEILEGIVARIVSHESSKHMVEVLKNFPPPPMEGAGHDLGPSLREICAANRSDETQQIKALLKGVGSSFCPDHSDWLGGAGDAQSRNADKAVVSKFLQSHPADFSTTKLQEVIRLMREKRFPAAFKCYHNYHKQDSMSNDNLFYKMVIHVHSDSAFRRYQKEMRSKPGLWPLYRGFFVDINLFKASNERAAEIAKNKSTVVDDDGGTGMSGKHGLADEDANLMIKLKFLTYKLRTFLIRNGLSILFKEGPAAYKAYYLRQMKIWGTSAGKQRELSKMLDEWAVYIRRKCGNKQLSSSVYLSEAEPFLEQYAKRSPQNQALIGSAGNLVRAEDFLAIVEGGRDEEGDLEKEFVPSSPSASTGDIIPKAEGLIVFFPGLPGSAKSALCKELLKAPGGFGDDRPVHTLMGDLVKGRYWQKVADERKKKPYSIMLADKNAPNEEVWRQIEDMCHRTGANAVPVVPDSEGTDSNPFSLDALAVFMYRVLQRSNHPGNLDKNSPNAGYVLLMFYHLYEGKSRSEFDGELVERFGSLVKIPLLKSDRNPLPDPVKSTLEEGINLYKLHTKKHGRLESTKGTYANEWAKWEKQLRDVLFGNSEYLNSVQVPFESAVKEVSEELSKIAKGEYETPEYRTPDSGKRKIGAIVFAAISLPITEIKGLLDNLAGTDSKAAAFLKDKNLENQINEAHVTLAHKRSHGVTAVANYGIFLHKQVPVDITALLFTDKIAAFEACPGSVEGERVVSKNEWPHVTLWTAEGVAAKEANMLHNLHLEGKATRIAIDPPATIQGPLEFY
ncbi:putative 2',3'-cyclic-nucleotide 3'-phosphodiesterase [Rosa chinensis]|uniref:Putative 2',3'-cyclic-nucleotide 3'-phosphodiesterase n=1 Tax=Rosa chinensis TaxID=74649 RepID=A0A2P6QHR2_ROSCH|nr:tRNA ligase 1 isoform X2 [Rosa chinensis]PRQ33718.1 putative 2',3'-cyclic-nucleotide 3'-phosphodiesterase [Rosa chinensis]